MVPALLAAGFTLSALGQIAQGRASYEQLMGAANAHRYNAAIKRWSADQTLLSTNLNEESFRRETRQQLGKQKTAVAESGFADTGTMADVQKRSIFNAELDALNIRYAGSLKAHTLRQEATGEEELAGSAERAARAARLGGYLGAAGSLFAGGGRYLGS